MPGVGARPRGAGLAVRVRQRPVRRRFSGREGGLREGRPREAGSGRAQARHARARAVRRVLAAETGPRRRFGVHGQRVHRALSQLGAGGSAAFRLVEAPRAARDLVPVRRRLPAVRERRRRAQLLRGAVPLAARRRGCRRGRQAVLVHRPGHAGSLRTRLRGADPPRRPDARRPQAALPAGERGGEPAARAVARRQPAGQGPHRRARVQRGQRRFAARARPGFVRVRDRRRAGTRTGRARARRPHRCGRRARAVGEGARPPAGRGSSLRQRAARLSRGAATQSLRERLVPRGRCRRALFRCAGVARPRGAASGRVGRRAGRDRCDARRAAAGVRVALLARTRAAGEGAQGGGGGDHRGARDRAALLRRPGHRGAGPALRHAGEPVRQAVGGGGRRVRRARRRQARRQARGTRHAAGIAA